MTSKTNGTASAAATSTTSPTASCPYPFATIDDAKEELNSALFWLYRLDDRDLPRAMATLRGLSQMMTADDAMECVDGEARKEMFHYLVEKVDEELNGIKEMIDHAFAVSLIVNENSLAALEKRPHLLEFARKRGAELCSTITGDPHEGWLVEAERLRAAKPAENDPWHAELTACEERLATTRATTASGVTAQLRFALGAAPAEGVTLGKLEAAALANAMASLAALDAAQPGGE